MVHTATVISVASLLLPTIEALSIDLTRPSLSRRDKNPHLPNFDLLTAEPDRIPPSAKSTTNRWNPGQYPQSCYDKAREAISDSDPRPKCQLRDLEVYDIAYEGCDQPPWIFCRFSNAEHSLEEMLAGMGTVPHGIRSKVSHVINMNGFGSGGGSSNNDRIYYGGRPEETFFSHESMHSNDKGFSISAAYQTAYDADSCVPDDYSNASPAENFAQLGTWLNFNINAKPIDTYTPGPDASCMANLLEASRQWLGDALPLATTKCAPRPANDRNVAGELRARDIVVHTDLGMGFESLLPHVPYQRSF